MNVFVLAMGCQMLRYFQRMIGLAHERIKPAKSRNYRETLWKKCVSFFQGRLGSQNILSLHITNRVANEPGKNWDHLSDSQPELFTFVIFACSKKDFGSVTRNERGWTCNRHL